MDQKLFTFTSQWIFAVSKLGAITGSTVQTSSRQTYTFTSVLKSTRAIAKSFDNGFALSPVVCNRISYLMCPTFDIASHLSFSPI